MTPEQHFVVFVSHTTQTTSDTIIAQEVAHGLRRQGIEAWIASENISVGTEWKPELMASLMQKCTHFLLIVTARSVGSEWVQKEISLAQTRFAADPGFRVLSLWIDDVGDYEHKEFMDRFQHVKVHGGLKHQIDALVSALCAPLLESKDFAERFLEACRLEVKEAQSQLREEGKYQCDTYVRRRFDSVMPDFLADAAASCLVIVDEAGTGKTSLLAHQASECLDKRIPTLLLANHEYNEYKRRRKGEGSFEDLVLNTLEHWLRAAGLPLPHATKRLVDLLERLPPSSNAAKLLVIVDGLNELHGADQFGPAYAHDPTLASASLFDVISRHASRDVKLVVSSRPLTWETLYADDAVSWRDQVWTPNWLAAGKADILGVALPAPLRGSDEGSKDGKGGRFVGLRIGSFSPMEACLALARYERVNRVHVRLSASAFSRLQHPFLLRMCVLIWRHQGDENRGTHHWHFPALGRAASPDQGIPILTEEDLDEHAMVSKFWDFGVERIKHRAQYDHQLGGMDVETSVAAVVDRILHQVFWVSGNDRTPRAAILDETLSPVIQAMIAEQMLVQETAEDGTNYIRFPLDKIVAFHVLEEMRDRLYCGSQSYVRQFLSRLTQAEQFGGLLPRLVSLCLPKMAEKIEQLLLDAAWCECDPPKLFVEACLAVPQGEMGGQLRENLLGRFVSFFAASESTEDVAAAPASGRERAREWFCRVGAHPGMAPTAILTALAEAGRLSVTDTCLEAAAAIAEAEEVNEVLHQEVHKLMQHALQLASSSREKAGGAALDMAYEYHNLANDCYKLGDYHDAARSYRKAVYLKPDLLESHFNMGLAYTRLHRFEDAITAHDKAIELDPSLVEAYYTRGLLHEYLRHYRLAVEDYEKVLELSPGYAEVREQLAVVRRKIDLLEEGAAEQATRLQDGAAEKLRDVFSLMRDGKTEEAKLAISEARRAGCNLLAQRPDKALGPLGVKDMRTVIDTLNILLWEEVAASPWKCGPLFREMIHSYLAIGECSLALEFSLAAALANPNDPECFRLIADVLTRDRRRESAVAAMQEVATSKALDPENAETYLTGGRVFEVLRETETAAKEFRRAAQLAGPAAAQASFRVVDLYSSQMRPEDLRRLHETAAKRYVDELSVAIETYYPASLAAWAYSGALCLAKAGDCTYQRFCEVVDGIISGVSDLHLTDWVSGEGIAEEELARQCRTLKDVFLACSSQGAS